MKLTKAALAFFLRPVVAPADEGGASVWPPAAICVLRRRAGHCPRRGFWHWAGDELSVAGRFPHGN